MANAYILNQIPSGYGVAMSLFVEMLVSAGWTYKGSGDGLSGYSVAGKIFTGTGTGALGWNNNRAWARLGAPDGRRELCLQHSAAGGLRIKYSGLAKFTLGSPSATVVPSASDERVYWGAGTDATPTLTAYFPAGIATSNVKMHGMASDTSPYGFWCSGATTPAGAMGFGLMLDPIEQVPEDVDPVVVHIGTTGAFGPGALGSAAVAQTTAAYPAPGTAQQGSWAHMDVALTQFLYVMPAQLATGVLLAGASPGTNTHIHVSSGGGLALNPFNGKHEALPVLWMRAAVASLPIPGTKGWSKSMRWTTIARTHGVDTLDSKQWICIGSVWLPWDGVTTPTN